MLTTALRAIAEPNFTCTDARELLPPNMPTEDPREHRDRENRFYRCTVPCDYSFLYQIQDSLHKTVIQWRSRSNPLQGYLNVTDLQKH